MDAEELKWIKRAFVVAVIAMFATVISMFTGIGSYLFSFSHDSSITNDNNSIAPALTSTPIPTSTATSAPATIPNSISVTSSPIGASIYLEDGKYEGETPKILNDINQGSHTITLKLEGYEDWSKGIEVDPDKTISISPTLTPKPTSNSNVISTPSITPTSDITPASTETPSSKPPITPALVDISKYRDWNYTIAKENFYVTVPEGDSFVSVTINIHNSGDVPISTDPSCWKFISDGVSYSNEPVTSAFYAPSQFEVKPGESLTFTINYLVKGTPTAGSLQYYKPTYYN